jgi:hypothetical protein
MKERPILFNAPMVRALLDGSKKQTRRVVNERHLSQIDQQLLPSRAHWSRPMPYGQAGDRLWVRETFADLTKDLGKRWERLNPQTKRYESGRDPFFWYRADGDQPDIGGSTQLAEPWKPSIFMPRVASRITLGVTGVRVDRLQDISVRDAIAEGIKPGGPENPDGIEKRDYRDLWESINGAGSWEANPWVWVVEFKPLQPPSNL